MACIIYAKPDSHFQHNAADGWPRLLAVLCSVWLQGSPPWSMRSLGMIFWPSNMPGQILAFTSRTNVLCCFWLGLQNEDGEHFCCLGNNVFISSCRVRNKKYLTEAREMSRHIINCINTLLVSSHNCHQTHSPHIFAALTTHSYLS